MNLVKILGLGILFAIVIGFSMYSYWTYNTTQAAQEVEAKEKMMPLIENGMEKERKVIQFKGKGSVDEKVSNELDEADKIFKNQDAVVSAPVAKMARDIENDRFLMDIDHNKIDSRRKAISDELNSEVDEFKSSLAVGDMEE